MREGSDAFAPLIAGERSRTPPLSQLERRVTRRRRRRWARGASVLALAAILIAGVIALVPNDKHAIRITNPSSTTTPKTTGPKTTRPTSTPSRPASRTVTDSAIGWRVTVPAGWTAQQSGAVCNPGEIGLVVSPDPHAFTASEGNAGCFDGSTGPLPGAVVVSLSRVAPASAATPPAPFPRSIADVPVDDSNASMHLVQIIEGSSEYLVRVVVTPGAPASSRRLVDAVLQSFQPIAPSHATQLVGARAATLALPAVSGIAFDTSGNLYLADSTLNRVLVVDPAGIVTRVFGSGKQGFSGDGGAAAEAELDTPRGVAVDNAGNVYIADGLSNRIRRVAPDGIITTYAGTGAPDSGPDGMPAGQTAMQQPLDVLWDTTTSSLYVAEGTRVRRIGADGIVHTVAGTSNGEIGYEASPGGLATDTAICDPSGIAITRDGSLWIADDCDKSIARVGPDGRIRKAPGFAFRLAAAPDGSVSAYFGRHESIDRVTPTSDTTILGELSNTKRPRANCAFYGGQGDDFAALAWKGNVLYFANPSMSRVCALQPDGSIDTIVGG